MRMHMAAAAAAAAVVLVLVQGVAAGVFPQPQSMVVGSDQFFVDGSTFQFDPNNHQSDLLNDALQRYFRIIFTSKQRRSTGRSNEITLSGLGVNVLTDNLDLNLNTDESYSLNITAPWANLTASSVFGAMRGLETFSQLVDRSGHIMAATISDFPRFRFRGLLVDTSRHFYPMSILKAHLDAMAYNKMNVFHWHLVDYPSFPFESATFPSLSRTGAFTPSHVYTHTDVKEIVQYAYERGIRVIPEFDSPGHMGAGYFSIPDLLTPCYTGSTPDGKFGPLNPTLDSTYTFMKALYAEVASLFPDKFVHVGGDEVDFTCWQSNPQITAWMAQHPELNGSYAQLESYYEVKLLNLLQAQGSSYLCWQELFDNGVALLPDTVIDVWKGGSTDFNVTMAAATKAGMYTVLSAPFYLDHISTGEDWINYYLVEPLNFEGDPAQKAKLVTGIKACDWSEFIDATNTLDRIWMRAAAVGERAWSNEHVRDVNDARARLHEHRCRLLDRGIPAEPVANAGIEMNMAFCPREFNFVYQPPF
eukprot:m.214626 g.214626  ORF g.214626 m.214626 type:complete len:531 (-) comp35968_c0_seq1:184-1776(-)